jgi:hypothetical protein
MGGINLHCYILRKCGDDISKTLPSFLGLRELYDIKWHMIRENEKVSLNNQRIKITQGYLSPSQGPHELPNKDPVPWES